MTPHFFKVRRGLRRQFRHDDVTWIFPAISRSVFETENLFAPLHEPFGEEKSRGELHVVTRRAHRNAQRIFAHADFERLFGGEIIFFSL